MYKPDHVTEQFLQYTLFMLLKSLRSSVSEGIRAVDERMCKQEDIRKKKVSLSRFPTLHAGYVSPPRVPSCLSVLCSFVFKALLHVHISHYNVTLST